MQTWLTTVVLVCVVAVQAAAQAPQVYLRKVALLPTHINHNNRVILTDEWSGVTFNPSTGTFWVVSNSRGHVVELQVSFDPQGSILSWNIPRVLPLPTNLDFEGIAFTDAARNSVYISDENGPGIQQYSLATGSRLGPAVNVPTVFTAPRHMRSNRGFEALAIHPDASVMYTANEEALAIDGPSSTIKSGTWARVQRYSLAWSVPLPTQQFAYGVEPIHKSPGDRNGLVDLVVLPDGTVLALERSWAGGLDFLSRVYQLDFSSATDISSTAYADGLVGKQFTPVGKQLLFAANLANLEGLALGPKLPNGHYVLLGVADNNRIGLNFIASFDLVPPRPPELQNPEIRD